MKEQIGKAFLAATGWEAVGEVPKAKKYVLIAAPHTSNWDFPYTIAAAFALGVDIRWLGKKQLFEGPLGPLLLALGGVAVDRSQANNLVERLADRFAECDELALTVPAEGTRSKGEYWKSGFYHIARRAQVPIALGFVDFGRKQVGFGPLIHPTGNVREDMDRIRAFYATKTGMHPELFTPPRLREEEPNHGG